MISFFHKIRQKLLHQNRVTRYLAYAVGEILLVVIGILIALQVNNWNENRKAQNQIKELLIALRSDLIKDTLMIHAYYPEVVHQYEINESFRSRVAHENASIDTLLQIARFEYNPNWTEALIYNKNAYNSFSEFGLLGYLPDSLNSKIRDFYNQKDFQKTQINRTTEDYRTKVSDYVDRYTFGSTENHDQGWLIDSLVWEKVDYSHLAASFQGLSNFKRFLFSQIKDEMDYSLIEARFLIEQINQELLKR